MRIGRAFSAVLAAAVLLASPGAIRAARGDRPQEAVGTTFRTSAELVALNVTVTDQRNQHISGLTKDDFAVFENGVRQEIVFFAASAVPLDLALMIDTSSSMGDKLPLVQDAATGFLGVLRPGDRAEVVGFADTAVILQPFTSDRAALEAAVRSTQPRGSTSLHNALYIVLQGLRKMAASNDGVRRQAIVVLSDGNDTASLISFEDVLEAVKRAGVAVYPISIVAEWEARALREQPGGRFFTEADYGLRTLARESGALSFFPEQVSELDAVYEHIANELSVQYSVGYPPSNPATDGSFRRIMVRLVNHPGARPRTRSGYYAASAASAWNRK